jgi:hypothetical protein
MLEAMEVGLEAKDLPAMGEHGFKKAHGMLETSIVKGDTSLVGGQEAAVIVDEHGNLSIKRAWG